MKIQQAVNRIFWRFGGKDQPNKKAPTTFPVNELDVEAYNSIKEFVEEQQKQIFANNELFAKMFILMYMKVLEKDNTTVYDTNARRKICDFLQMDLDSIIQYFTDFMNDMEYDNLIIRLGLEIKHPAMQTDQEVYEFIDKLNEALRKPENEKVFMRELWEHKTVKECLIEEVNQAIELCR